VPHSGQNLAPLVSLPQFGHGSLTIATIAVPHSGQNLVPAGATVPSFGQRTVPAALASSAAAVALLTASPSPRALAKPLSMAPACSASASAISCCRGLSSVQNPVCSSKHARHTTRMHLGHSRKRSFSWPQAFSSCSSVRLVVYRGSAPVTLSAMVPPRMGMRRSNPPAACLPTSLAMVAPTAGWLRYSRSQVSQ